MTKKDYELIARVFHRQMEQSQNREEGVIITRVAVSLSFALVDTNPRFDSAKFLTACGVFNDVVDMHR